LRPAFDALFAIDDAMADVVLRSTQPALGAIKLAWWRERLEELDDGKVPAEPRLRNAAKALLPRGVTGAALAKLEDGWATLLEEVPDAERAGERGACLFRLGARLLKSEFDDETLGVAGRLFAGVDLARRGLMDIPRESPGRRWPIIPRRVRPLTALAALAVRDVRRGGPPFEPEATPGHAWTLMYHRLTGRFPS
jgi:phytoene synthase